MQEIWVDLKEFPDYAVSNLGRYKRLKTGTVLRPLKNQYGILMLNLNHKNSHTSRSLARAVAENFVEGETREFNTPIHVDGNKENCRADNLVWRPRWFALSYHKQFSEPKFNTRIDLELVETGERYPGWKEPCIQYGLRYVDIRRSYLADEPTFPIGMHFRLI